MRKLAIAALLAMPLLASAANLVTNGSFESNIMPSGNWAIFSTLTGWTGTPNIELRDSVAGAAFDGVNFVELDTYANSGMFQDIATVTGAHYNLSFAYSPRPSTSNTNDINVLWNGALIAPLGGSNGNSTHHWTVYNFDVLGGPGSTSRLAFNAAGVSDSYGGSLDAVSVTSAVPEPQTYALLLAGLCAVVFMNRRRKQ